jgi:hypothetical protein
MHLNKSRQPRVSDWLDDKRVGLEPTTFAARLDVPLRDAAIARAGLQLLDIDRLGDDAGEVERAMLIPVCA